MSRGNNAESGWRLLIVDDSPEDRAELRRLLLTGSERRLEFIEADSGTACLEFCQKDASGLPDCILLDYHLPDYDAPELLRALGGPASIPCPVLVVTGSSKHVKSEDLLGLGAQDYIGKSWINAESLIRSVENTVERYRLTQELKDSHAQFRAFLENSSVVAWMKNEDGRLVYLSRNFEKRFALLGKDWRGMTDYDLWPEPTVEKLRENDRKVLSENRPLEFTEFAEEPDGSQSWWLSTKFPFINQQGSKFVGGMAVDITDRIKTEQALRESEEFNRSILDNSADCIKVIDLDGNLIQMNRPGLCAMEIEDFSGFEGKQWSTLWPGEGGQNVEAALETARSRGVGRFKGFCPTAKGTPKWWDVMVTAVRDELGNPKHFVSFSRDITERERYELKLKTAAGNDAYRVSLSDTLRPLTDPLDIQAEASRLLGLHLGASRVHYGKLTRDGRFGVVAKDYCNGVPSSVGKYRLNDYGPAVMAEFRAGKTLVINNVMEDSRLTQEERAKTAALSIGAYVIVALHKIRRPVALFVVHQDRPRHWTENEILLIEETADRTWSTVERADIEAALRENEEKLRRANERFIAALQASPVAIFTQDRNLRYTWIENPGLGYHFKEMLGKNDYDLFKNSEDADRLTLLKKRVLKTGEASRTEVEISKEGVQHWFDLSVHAQRKDKKIIGIICTAVDITQRKHEEEIVRQNELRLRLALDAAYLISFEWDIKRNEVRRYVSVDPGLPPTPEEAPNTFEEVCQIVHPEDRERFMSNVHAALAREDGYYENEFRIVHPGGQIVWLFERGRVERDSKGRPSCLIGLSQDITQRKRAEESLQRYAEELQDADHRKNEFLAMLGHELRNPLTPISNVAQILSMPSLDDKTLAWAMEVLNRNVAHITQLVDDLLDVSRITRGLITLQKERIELNRLLNEAVESVEILYKAKRHALNLHFTDQPVFLEGDPVRLTQIFTNLLNNAAKYTVEGGIIELTVTLEDGWVNVSVKDNGMGIEPRLLPRIFDLFTQGERSLARSEGGLGLGLSLVKKMVEMHDGHVSAHSQGANRGAEFVVKLPRLVEQSETRQVSKLMTSEKEDGRSLRILLIEDNLDAIESVALWLKKMGHQVWTAPTGAQGIIHFNEFKPDLIIVDIGLPDLDGYQVARKIREGNNNKQVKIIALSGYAPGQNGSLNQQSDFDHYMIKPPNLNQLRELISGYQRSIPSIN